MAKPQYEHLWALAHAERAALADDLDGLSAEQWRHDTLCDKWDVEEVVTPRPTSPPTSVRSWCTPRTSGVRWD